MTWSVLSSLKPLVPLTESAKVPEAKNLGAGNVLF